MDELDQSVVHQNLESKLKIGGLEAMDLLVVLIFAAIMSIFFGSGTIGLIFVLILPMILLLALYFLKRNKPDGYLVGLLRFYLLPGHFSASSNPKDEEKLNSTITYTEKIND